MAVTPAPPGTFPLPSTLNRVPPEGARQASYRLVWANLLTAGGYSTVINLLPTFFTGQFSTPQSVYIDNSRCPYTFRITCDQTQYTLEVPGFSVGMYPLIGGQAPQYTCSLDWVDEIGGGYTSPTAVPAGSTRLFILNTPQPYFQHLLFDGISNTSFYSGNAASNQTWALLPQRNTLSQYYVVTSIFLSLFIGAALAATTEFDVNIFDLFSAVPQYSFWRESFLIRAGDVGVVWERNIVPATPWIVRTGGYGPHMVWAQNVTVPFILYYNSTYRLVTIQ